MLENRRMTYAESGVDMEKEDKAMTLIKPLLEETCSYRKGVLGKCVTTIGHFAGIVKLDNRLGLAMKTDGVGTKVFIAQLLQKYDTIGIDCVAMNVNDIICTGAEPISFVDYIATQKLEPEIIRQIVWGLKEGAKIARISITGGETAQLPEMVEGLCEGRGFDLVGMCTGIVELDKIIDGHLVKDEDVLLGLSSSGLHSNGYTMARRVLLDEMHFELNKWFEEFGRTLGEELLEPTFIYVPEIMEILKANLEIKLLAHITSRGFLNLHRVGNGYGYVIDYLPDPQPIFRLIKKYGNSTNEEMYHRFNMGVGMCMVVSKDTVDDVKQIVEKHKKEVFTLGRAKKDPERKIVVRPLEMVGDPRTGIFKKYA
jgi:phosphoribosylformylglycinamidine cyclo-ligase